MSIVGNLELKEKNPEAHLEEAVLVAGGLDAAAHDEATDGQVVQFGNDRQSPENQVTMKDCKKTGRQINYQKMMGEHLFLPKSSCFGEQQINCQKERHHQVLTIKVCQGSWPIRGLNKPWIVLDSIE